MLSLGMDSALARLTFLGNLDLFEHFLGFDLFARNGVLEGLVGSRHLSFKIITISKSGQSDNRKQGNYSPDKRKEKKSGGLQSQSRLNDGFLI